MHLSIQMKNSFWIAGIMSVLGLPGIVSAQDFEGFENLFTPVRTYVTYQCPEEISIDGKATEKSWQKAEWSEYFEDIEGDLKPRPTYETRFKMLWDAQNLYYYFELKEPHVWAYYDRHDMVVFHENDIELFIDPDRDCYNYFEYELNAQNILFDLFLNKPYRNGAKPDIEWNAPGFESAVYVDGTLNNPADKDRKWCVEVKIPFASFARDEHFEPAGDGDMWKMNFSRVQWHTEVVDGKYVRVKDKASGRNLPENNWVWSPQGVINMHFPERWGLVQFSKEAVGTKTVSFQMPLDELLARHLWLVYYKQQQFRNENQRFAASLEELQVSKSGMESKVSFELEMTATADNFKLKLTAANGCVLMLDNSSLLTKTTN